MARKRSYMKYLLAIALLGIAAAPSRPKDTDVTGVSPELTKEYDTANFMYFGGRLPHVNVQLTDSQPPWIAQTNMCGPRCFTIVISNPWTPAPIEKEEALLHEMCHVKTDFDGTTDFDVHGPSWENCMLHLAKEGAFDPKINGVYRPVW
jgi:hypothetical protein